MNALGKLWIVLIGVMLAMAVVACSYGSILPALIASPTPTVQPSPTVSPMPILQASPTASPMPVVQPCPTLPPPQALSLAGRWIDPDSWGTITTIIEQDGGYAVESVINPGRGGNELTATNWSNGVLTWTYCIPEGNCITTVTGSLDGNSLHTTWTDDSGISGQTVFLRLA